MRIRLEGADQWSSEGAVDGRDVGGRYSALDSILSCQDATHSQQGNRQILWFT